MWWFLSLQEGDCTTQFTSTSSWARFATSPLFAYVCNSAPDSSPSELLIPDCVRFSCCSPIALIRFNCCSPFASASAAARHLCLLLPDCVRFNCSPIMCTSAAAPRLRPLRLLLPDCIRLTLVASPVLENSSPCLMFSNGSSRFSKLKYEGRASLVYSPATRTSHFRHSHTHS